MKIMKYLLLGGIVFSSAAKAQTITLEQVFQYVIDKHPAFLAANYQPKIVRKNKEAAEGWQDWYMSADATYRYYKNQERQEEENIIYIDSRGESESIGAGVSKSLWNIGARFRLGYSASYYDRDSEDAIYNENSYRTGLNASLTVDLWRNFGGVLDRNYYESFDYQIPLSELSKDERKELFLSGVSHNYLSWALAHELQSISESYLAMSKDLLNYVESEKGKLKGGTRYITHSQRFNVATLRKHADFERRFKEQQIRLSEYLSREQIMQETPEYDVYKIEPPNLEGSELQVFVENTRLLKRFSLQEKLIAHNRLAIENSANPRLSLTLSGYVSGDDDSHEDSYSKENESYSARLGFSHPIGNTTARARLAIDDLRYMEFKDYRENSKLQLLSQLQGVLKELTELKKVLEIAKQSMELAHLSAQQDLQNFKTGDMDIAVLIQGMENEFQEKISYALSAAGYQHAFINFLAMTDQLWKNDAEGSVLISSGVE